MAVCKSLTSFLKDSTVDTNSCNSFGFSSPLKMAKKMFIIWCKIHNELNVWKNLFRRIDNAHVFQVELFPEAKRCQKTMILFLEAILQERPKVYLIGGCRITSKQRIGSEIIFQIRS